MFLVKGIHRIRSQYARLASRHECLLMPYIPGTKQCCTRVFPGPALQGMNELSTQRVIHCLSKYHASASMQFSTAFYATAHY